LDREKFSSRYGFEPQDVEISVRHDAPEELRAVIVDIAYESGSTPHALRGIVCRVLRVKEDLSNWSPFPNLDGEVRNHLESCEWYEVYDLIEVIYRSLKLKEEGGTRPEHFESEINKYFRKRGIGWQLKDGLVEVRGSDSFESVVAKACEVLSESGRGTAQREIREALRDMSRRPEADLTGALQHAFAAVECVARDIAGEPKLTLGQVLKKNPGLVPSPLNAAVEKMWGFASDQGRHLLEGRDPGEAEVEFAVVAAAAIATYLVRKNEK
jgi:AbiJ N-terminal domain 4